MARPQRQARASVSYREDHLDEYFGVKQGLAQQVVVEQARAKRTLTLKRSSRTQERANAKDRAEAKQLERAISESLTSSCEKTYSRGGLERSARVTNQSRDVQPPLAQLDEGLQSREPSNAFQFLVDAASADNSTLVGAQTTICDETNKAATSPIVKQQTDTYSTLPAVTAQPCGPQTPQDLQQVNEVGDCQEQLNTSTIQTATAAPAPAPAPAAASSSLNSEDEWDNEEVGCSDSGNEAKQPVPDKKKGPCRRSIVMTNSDDDEWSAEEESQSDEDEDDGDAFAEDSDDSDCGKGGAKKKRRTAKPAVKKKPPEQTLRRGVPTTGALRQGPPSNGKHMSSGLAKEPAIETRRQKPAGLGQENLPYANVGKISGQAIPTSKLTPSVPAKVTPESRKSLKANGPAVSPASKGLQHSRLPWKPVNISTTKTSIAPTTPATGPPLQFPSTQHRRVLGLSKRFQPPPLHPYLHGT